MTGQRLEQIFEEGPDPEAESPAPVQFRQGRMIRHPDATRAIILDAAIQEFAAKGFAGARVDAIALRSKTNKRMLYHFFGDKEGLYVAVLEVIFTNVTAAGKSLHLSRRQPLDGIRELALHTWNYFLTHPEFVSLLATENILKAEYSSRSKTIPSTHGPLLAEIEKLLQRGIEQGLFRADVNPVTVYMTIAGLSFFYINNRYTLALNLDANVWQPTAIDAWGEHIVTVTLAFLAPAIIPGT
ncbi:TetR/AcrR family transcriptional regulator [Agrobacterium vitis]|uniref:TetR/AcrR family transcriptional regulator n=1 Tax=Agrobacterium vitis TaxID=373 RepID=UPI0012E7DB08|nr:TetR/AcrR family transcriptional regulator [Agrobacterium vitis]MVA25216.1 TetR family transcriptional regulator [Agrobacterium vitis]